MQKAKLLPWDLILANSNHTANDKKTYFKVYYPNFAGYAGIRKFYTPYFGKDVLVLPVTKHGKPSDKNDYSVYSMKGIHLFNVHASWIQYFYDEYFDIKPDRWRPKDRPAPAYEPEPVVEIRRVFEPAVEIRRVPEPVKVLPPKPDFSNLTFEQLFEV